MRSAAPIATSCGAFAAASSTRPTWSPIRATRARSARSGLGDRGRRGRDAVRRRDERGRRGRAGRRPQRHAGVVTIDMSAVDRVLEVDPVSLSARIQAGATGPVLEDQLREHGLTLRHYPQSFQFSTLGGLDRHPGGRALLDPDPHRRSGRVGARGHARRRVVVAAAARLGRRRLPRPDAAGLRGNPRDRSPRRGCASGSGRGTGLGGGCASRSSPAGRPAVRALAQSGLRPAACRLIDPAEAR